MRKKKYVRKKKNNFKKKTCRCFICNEEGHYAPECPKKGKSAKKMIKVLEEQDFEILIGEEISDIEEIIYEVSSEDETSSDEEINDHIFMLQEVPSDELENIRLKDVVGEEVSFTEDELARFEKMKQLHIPAIYEIFRFNFFLSKSV